LTDEHKLSIVPAEDRSDVVNTADQANLGSMERRLKGNAPTSDATWTVWYFPVKARGQEIRERNPEVC